MSAAASTRGRGKVHIVRRDTEVGRHRHRKNDRGCWRTGRRVTEAAHGGGEGPAATIARMRGRGRTDHRLLGREIGRGRACRPTRLYGDGSAQAPSYRLCSLARRRSLSNLRRRLCSGRAPCSAHGPVEFDNGQPYRSRRVALFDRIYRLRVSPLEQTVLNGEPPSASVTGDGEIFGSSEAHISPGCRWGLGGRRGGRHTRIVEAEFFLPGRPARKGSALGMEAISAGWVWQLKGRFGWLWLRRRPRPSRG